MVNNTYHADVSTNADISDLHQLSLVELVFWFSIYTTIALMAVGGNLLVLFVIATRPRMHSITNYFIANLAIGDFFTGLLAIPFKFQAALLQEWFLPAFTCKTATFSESVSLSVSVFTLTCIAADRFRAIISPGSQKMSRQMALFVIALIWVFSIMQSLPFGMFHQKTLFTIGHFSGSPNQSDRQKVDNITDSKFMPYFTAASNASRSTSDMTPFTTYQCVAIYGDMVCL